MPHPSDISFHDLLRSVRAGSEEAAAELMRRYGPWMRRVVARRLPKVMRRQFDSSDFTQTAWASIFANCEEFDRFSSPDEFLKFAAQLARNKVAMEARRRLGGQAFAIRREPSFSDARVDAEKTPSPHSPTPSQEAMAGERWLEMIANQTDEYSAILGLRREGHTFQEIAEQLSLSESHVRRLYQRALLRESHGGG